MAFPHPVPRAISARRLSLNPPQRKLSMKKIDVRQMMEKNQFARNYKRMWPFIKPFWPMALLSLLICVPVGSLDAVIALFLKPYTDVVVVGKSMDSPWYIPILIVSFTTVQGLLNFGGAYLNAWVGGNAEVKSSEDYCVYKNTWSSFRWFTYTRSNKMWSVGCFYGTGAELITKAYKDSEKSGKCYEAVVKAQEAIEKVMEG